MNEENEGMCLEDNGESRLSDGEAIKIMVKLNQGQSMNTLSTITSVLRHFKAIKGLSLRQISRLTGLGLGYQTVKRA
jgi:hypothetical protein